MKKIVLALAAIAMIGLFTTSCNKKCTCKTYLNGVVMTTSEDVELDKDSYKKCSDMNTELSVGGMTTKTVCKRK